MTNKAYQYIWVPQAGDPDIMEWREGTLSQPVAGEVCIRIEAAGVISADTAIREGYGHPGSPPLPHIPGHEVVGVIEAVGDNVTNVLVGQRVVAILVAGGYATHVNVESWKCFPITADVDNHQAVAVLINYWTAHYCLHRVAQVQADDTVLIHGASGGVGTALLELGQLAGATLLGTASARKHNHLTSYDVQLIDYHTTDFEQVVYEQYPDGLQAVFDPIGGSYWRKSYRLLARGGKLIIFGAKDPRPVNVMPYVPGMMIRHFLLPDGKSVHPVGLSPTRQREAFLEDIPHLQSLLAERKLTPKVSEVLPMSEASQAHRLMEQGHHVGKIVLVND